MQKSALVGVAVLLHACSSDPMPPPTMDASFPTGPVPYEQVQAIWDRTCSGSACHIGAAFPQQELDLTGGRSYALLVGVASSEVPEMKRVVANSPAQSYLYAKLEPGTAPIMGVRMPSG